MCWYDTAVFWRYEPVTACEMAVAPCILLYVPEADVADIPVHGSVRKDLPASQLDNKIHHKTPPKRIFTAIPRTPVRITTFMAVRTSTLPSNLDNLLSVKLCLNSSFLLLPVCSTVAKLCLIEALAMNCTNTLDPTPHSYLLK